MSELVNYDDVLSSILVNEKSILGFLSAIFNFLARRTDFYYVPAGQYENMGFPPGVAEELVIKVLRKCDPNNVTIPHDATKHAEINDEIMCSTIAQEVEVVAEEDKTDEVHTLEENETKQTPSTSSLEPQVKSNERAKPLNKDLENLALNNSYTPPVILTQKNSETYNGAERDQYSWSQTIMELDVIIKLPHLIKAKDLKVTINSSEICVAYRNGDVIIQDSLPYKIKTIESFWSISEGRLLIHFEKVQERWWNKFLYCEESIDLSKIDCSRPLDELPEDHIAKVRELQWNQEQKLKGLPTSDEMRNLEILKKAWNAAGSPFKGQEFNPDVLKQSNMAHFSKE